MYILVQNKGKQIANTETRHIKLKGKILQIPGHISANTIIKASTETKVCFYTVK